MEPGHRNSYYDSKSPVVSMEDRKWRSNTVAYHRDTTGTRPRHDGASPTSIKPSSPTNPTSSRLYTPHKKGRNMFEDGEYVETKSLGLAGGRDCATMSNIQKKAAMHSMTVRLPKNPFIEEDYADMTGHQRSPVQMDMMKQTLKHMPTKRRSYSTSATNLELDSLERPKRPSDLEYDQTDGRITRTEDKSERSRSTTVTSQASTSSTVKSNQPSIAEERFGGGMSPTSISAPKITLAPSDTNTESLQTTPHSTEFPDGNHDQTQIAVVIEETAPPVNSYSTFSPGMHLSKGDGTSQKDKLFSDKKSTAKITAIVIAVLSIVCCVAAIAVLGYVVSEKDREIARLQNVINLLQNSGSGTEMSTLENNLETTLTTLTTSREFSTSPSNPATLSLATSQLTSTPPTTPSTVESTADTSSSRTTDSSTVVNDVSTTIETSMTNVASSETVSTAMSET